MPCRQLADIAQFTDPEHWKYVVDCGLCIVVPSLISPARPAGSGSTSEEEGSWRTEIFHESLVTINYFSWDGLYLYAHGGELNSGRVAGGGDDGGGLVSASSEPRER